MNGAAMRRILLKRQDSLYFVMCTVGILVSYLLNGLLVEAISSKDGFRFYLSILFFPILFNSSFAYAMIVINKQRKTSYQIEEALQNRTDYVNLSDLKAMRICILCSFFYVAAMFCANASLVYVTYPMQVVGKSAKPIPVMLFSILGAGCSYSRRKYATVVLIVVGTSVFLYSNQDGSGTTNTLGITLLVLSLIGDGAVAVCQERIRALGAIDSFDLMLTINKWAGIILGVVVLLSGEFFSFLYFCISNRTFWLQLVLLGITSALGQNFIFLTICRYGPLACSLITTTRKFFAVLLSVLIFKHTMSIDKWLSMCAVFSGLVLEAAFPT